MKKSKEFENILNDCLERMLTRGETIERCLQGYPGYADELKPLLETAMTTMRASVIEPRRDFRERARYEFYSALREREHKKSRPLFGWNWQQQWVMAIALVFAILLTGGGTVALASGSMPDEPLYPVKLATEQARLAVTPSAMGKAELYAMLADNRVTEIARMADKGKPEQIERTAQRLDIYLTNIAVLSSGEEIAGGGAEPVMAPAAEKARTPEKAPVMAEAPAVKKAPVPAQQAREEGEEHVIVTRRAELKVIIARNAIEHSARLRALLEVVPESAKPALLRAIAVSESGYQRAIESLD